MISTSTYTGVPAPVMPPSDPWFPDPPRTQKQLDYMEQETLIKQREATERLHAEMRKETVESEDIHQKMYEIASKNWTTVKETKGWQSGTGYGQFRG